MRTFGIVLTTAIITALLTSAAWIVLYNAASRDESPPAATGTNEQEPPPPAPAAAEIAVPDETPDIVFTPQATATSDLMAKTLTIPVLGFDAADLTPQFEDGRGGGRQHLAIDLMAERGTPVVAVDDGILVKFFESERGGLTIYQFDPTETFVYYYAHLDSYAEDIEEGDAVRRGQVIGTVGSTGNANDDAPHLHFAIERLGPEKNWWQAEPLDPYPVLSAIGSPTR